MAPRHSGLGCLLVPIDDWTERLDVLVEMRQLLRDQMKLQPRSEVKGEWLAGVKKHFHGFGDSQLRSMFVKHLRVANLISSGAFAIVIDKDKVRNRERSPDVTAWEYLLQRLRERSNRSGRPILLSHDNGSTNVQVRAQLRRFRRVSWDSSNEMVRAPLLIEDPIPRDSAHSYFIQLADLCAYAASRRVLPNKGKRGKSAHRPCGMSWRAGRQKSRRTAAMESFSGRGMSRKGTLRMEGPDGRPGTAHRCGRVCKSRLTGCPDRIKHDRASRLPTRRYVGSSQSSRRRATIGLDGHVGDQRERELCEVANYVPDLHLRPVLSSQPAN